MCACMCLLCVGATKTFCAKSRCSNGAFPFRVSALAVPHTQTHSVSVVSFVASGTRSFIVLLLVMHAPRSRRGCAFEFFFLCSTTQSRRPRGRVCHWHLVECDCCLCQTECDRAAKRGRAYRLYVCKAPKKKTILVVFFRRLSRFVRRTIVRVVIFYFLAPWPNIMCKKCGGGLDLDGNGRFAYCCFFLFFVFVATEQNELTARDVARAAAFGKIWASS